MTDVLLPRTDGGALVQALTVLALLGGVLVFVRRDREWRRFVLGLAVLALAWFGLRAVH
jgi:Na+-translocating ferredoxin:NAD+ oxidoreductase RnfD subunit